MKKLDESKYTIKHTSIGWWVDGKCGYLVVGYCKTKEEVIEKAIKKK